MISCVPSACFACVAGFVSCAFALGVRVRCRAACRVRGWARAVCVPQTKEGRLDKTSFGGLPFVRAFLMWSVS
eukprot:5846305-Prymnesium_polylepis.1